MVQTLDLQSASAPGHHDSHFTDEKTQAQAGKHSRTRLRLQEQSLCSDITMSRCLETTDVQQMCSVK